MLLFAPVLGIRQREFLSPGEIRFLDLDENLTKCLWSIENKNDRLLTWLTRGPARSARPTVAIEDVFDRMLW